MSRNSSVMKAIGLVVVVVVLTTGAFAERYTFGDGWFLDLDLSLIPVSSPMRIEIPENPIASFTWLIFPPSEENGTTMLWITWGNYSSLDAAMGINAVTTSAFGSGATQLGATNFNTDTDTLVDVLGMKRYGVEATNGTTREVKGYYVPVTVEDINSYRILTLWATNVTSQQWTEFLDTISISKIGDSEAADSFIEIEGEPTTEELKAMMVESAEKVETATFTLDMDQTAKVIKSSETNRTLLTLNFDTRLEGEGALNVSARAIKMSMTTTTTLGKLGEIVSEMEMYMKNDTMYTNIDGNWTRMPGTPEEIWDLQNQVSVQAELLNASKIELVGSEDINGEAAYKVKVLPDIEMFTMIPNQLMGLMPLYGMTIAESFNESKIDWTTWVSRESHLPLKNQVALTMILPADMLDLPVIEVGNIELEIESNTTVTYSNFNKPVLIEVPEEAKNAATWIDI